MQESRLEVTKIFSFQTIGRKSAIFRKIFPKLIDAMNNWTLTLINAQTDLGIHSLL